MSNSTEEANEPNKGETLTMAEIAYESILSGIVTRRYAGGEVLQEARIAQSLGLSRTPVREALGRLEGEGLLVRSGRTLMVCSVTVKDYLEALYVRRLIETEAVGLACESIPLEVLQALRARIAELTDPKMVSPDAHWKLDDDIHQTIANFSGNNLLAHLIADLRLKTRLFNLEKVPDRFIPGKNEHLMIIDALIAGDRESARLAMNMHLDNVKKGILNVIGV